MCKGPGVKTTGALNDLSMESKDLRSLSGHQRPTPITQLRTSLPAPG